MTRRAAFQGVPGAWGEAAAASFLGPGGEAVPCPTFADALAAAESGSADFAVLPVENSIEGSVGEALDLLCETGLRAAGEVYQRIEHCLVGSAPDAGAVRTVYSHPQALGQCRGFIRARGMRTIPTYDTAGSVPMVRGMGPEAACIASRRAAELHGVPVIEEGIADSGDNVTRFLAMSARGAEPAGPAKTSIVFGTRHERGALHAVVRALAGGGANLTKIESRPRRGSRWEYNFFVDFEGSASEPAAAAALEEARAGCTFLRVLGSYPAAGP